MFQCHPRIQIELSSFSILIFSTFITYIYCNIGVARVPEQKEGHHYFYRATRQLGSCEKLTETSFLWQRDVAQTVVISTLYKPSGNSRRVNISERALIKAFTPLHFPYRTMSLRCQVKWRCTYLYSGWTRATGRCNSFGQLESATDAIRCSI